MRVFRVEAVVCAESHEVLVGDAAQQGDTELLAAESAREREPEAEAFRWPGGDQILIFTRGELVTLAIEGWDAAPPSDAERESGWGWESCGRWGVMDELFAGDMGPGGPAFTSAGFPMMPPGPYVVRARAAGRSAPDFADLDEEGPGAERYLVQYWPE
ncbi:hypothetical protein [Streptomyces sp. WM6378]|uniref:hypothetical protein n=1 Tax=Streptomyces sp. WM6378 TaxID=1415557 RepID=UPI0006AF331D|nr:hypothetical protein [Streptomyces sp. WM6378]KOU37646.1 hypothetical protein ADK54_31565 [Streptomyces sp. WM6378]